MTGVQTCALPIWSFNKCGINHLLSQAAANLRLLALIETASGLLALPSITATASTTGLDALIFGADDYAADVGATRSESGAEVAFARGWVQVQDIVLQLMFTHVSQDTFYC